MNTTKVATSRASDYTMRDYILLLRRRRLLLLTTFAVVIGAAIGLAFMLPELYASKADISIEKPAIDTRMINPLEDPYKTDIRLDRITQEVLKWDNLAALVDSLDLYREPELSPRERVGMLREHIEIVPMFEDEDPDPRSDSEIIGFQVVFLHTTPESAQQVTSRLSELYIEEDERSRTEAVTALTSFLSNEAAKLRAELQEAETALAEFKERNADKLPETAKLNLQTLERADADIESIEREIRTLQERKNLLLAELAQVSPSIPVYTSSGQAVYGSADQLKALQQQYISLSAKYAPDHPTLVRLKKEIEILSTGSASDADRDLLARELAAKRAELSSAKQRYADNHPTVQSLANAVARLEDQVAALPAPGTRNIVQTEPDNPAYVQLRIQLEGVDAELTALRARRAGLKNRVVDLEQSLAGTWGVESELGNLMRDYEIAEKGYREIRDELTSAQQSAALEIERKAERYELRRAASLPLDPARPNRPLIVILGFILAIGTATGAVFVAEALATTVRGARDLERLVNMPPIATIPRIYHRPRRGQQSASATLIALILGGTSSIVATSVDTTDKSFAEPAPIAEDSGIARRLA